MASRVCSECGNSLADFGPQAKTCSSTCRSQRSRRIKRIQRDNGKKSALPAHQKQVQEIVRHEVPDVAHELLKEELRPVVRETLTEDVLHAIDKMVSLTPLAVQALHEDLYSDDATIRQRAYTLLMKYTVGHQALVRPADADPNTQLVVNFELPRPGRTEPAQPSEAVELRSCDMCGEDKPAGEFIANSQRCRDCWDEQRKAVAEKFGVDA